MTKVGSEPSTAGAGSHLGPAGPASAERLFREAVALQRGGRLEPAIAAYRRVTELMPAHIGALWRISIG